MSGQHPNNLGVVNTTEASFTVDVIEASRERLIIVDFWAEWCAPCRMLAPVLEKLASEAGGNWSLVKANTDEVQTAAASFGVSGIPALFAVFEGKVLDALQGLQPESALKVWLERLQSIVARLRLERLVEQNPSEAESQLEHLYHQSPYDSDTAVLLAKCYLANDKSAACRTIIEKLEKRGFLEPEAEKIKASLEMENLGQLDVVQAKLAVEQSPNDLEAKLKLAEALVGSNEFAEAFDICLELVAMDRNNTGERARSLMVDVFRVLTDESPLTSEYRRKLASVLY